MALGWVWVLGRSLVQKYEEVEPQTGDCAFWDITGWGMWWPRGSELWYVQGYSVVPPRSHIRPTGCPVHLDGPAGSRLSSAEHTSEESPPQRDSADWALALL